VTDRRSLNLVIAASEAIPYAKTGGLADVTGALPQEFARLGHDVLVLLPRYRCLNDAGRSFRVVARLPVQTAEGITEVTVEEDMVTRDGKHPPYRVWALRRDDLFDRAGLYQEQGKDYPDNLDRFAWFSRAIVEVVAYLRREREWKPDLLHLHDWQTALCAVYLKTTERHRPDLQSVKTVLTLHNVGYQGIFPGAQYPRTGLPASLFTSDGLEFFGSVNLLKGGIIFADFLTTVSPTYAKEILTPEFGFGLEAVLRARKDHLVGIINGIDSDLWNPEKDRFLPATYSVEDRRGKKRCKQALQREFALPEKDVPVLASIARLTSQKGVDLLEAIIPDLMTKDLQLVILGVGEPAIEASLKALQTRYSDRMGLHIGFDEGLAHRIEAGADMFVMPSRYEPCGLSQLYSLRYGTVPVVRKTGGLADTVVPVTPGSVRLGRATGFHVQAATPEALLKSISTAIDAYHNPETWGRLVETGMRTDVSWARSARAYDELFRKLGS
jgi:starch synthase